MEKYFANYNQSLALKELGFNEICFATFDSDKWFDIQDFGQNYDTFPSHIIAAPLKSQVFEWFREKYGLHSTITSISQESWQWHITKPGESLGKLYDEDFYTYEEAESACIEKLIEIVQNGK